MVITSQEDLYVKVTGSGGSTVSENWDLVQSLDISESPAFLDADQAGSTGKRRIRASKGVRMSVTQINSDGSGVWDISISDEPFTVDLYSDILFEYMAALGTLEIPVGTNYAELTGCRLGEKRKSSSKDVDVMSVTIEADDITWSGTTS